MATEYLWYLVTKAQYVQDNIATMLSAAFRPLASVAGVLMPTVPAILSSVSTLVSASYDVVSTVFAVV